MKFVGYFVLLGLALVLLKFVSEFDYQLRKDKIEYIITWEENFKSDKGKKLVLHAESEKISIMTESKGGQSGRLEVITHAIIAGCDNIIRLKTDNKIIERKNVTSSELDTIIFRSHNLDGFQKFDLKDTLYVDFEVVVRDSTLIQDGQTFEISNIKLFEQKEQKPIF